MIYKFKIGSEEAGNFKVEIAIDSNDTFLNLRNAILDAAGYDKQQIDSFYVCDDEWHKEKEITYVDMDSYSDEDIWLMDETHLDELIYDEGQKLKFVFDYMSERYFYILLTEVVPGKTLHDPVCQRKEGRPPREILDDLFAVPKTVKIDEPSLDDIEEEFYGDDEFDEEELSDFNFDEQTDDER